MRVLIIILSIIVAGCALPGASSVPFTSNTTHNVTVTLAADRSFDSNYLRTLIENANAFTGSELGVRLVVVSEASLVDSVPAEVISSPSALPYQLRKIVQTQNGSEADILFVALPHNGAIGSALDRFQGVAEMVGGVGTRKNNLAIGFLSGVADDDTRVVLHEIGHLLGANHAMTGFMVPDTVLISFATGYSSRSRDEIYAALNHRQAPFQSHAPTFTAASTSSVALTRSK